MCATSVVIAAPPFLGSSLAFMMVYVWARRNDDVRMSFLVRPPLSIPRPPLSIPRPLGFSSLCLLAGLHLFALTQSSPDRDAPPQGLFTFRAPFLPWVLLAFSVLLGNSPSVDLMGIAVGHVPQQRPRTRVVSTHRH